MTELEWLALARADILAIVDYVSDNNPGAAQRIKDEIETTVAKLADFPKMGRPGRIEGTRGLIVWANYVIVYQENDLIIRIVRVLHDAQQWPPTEEQKALSTKHEHQQQVGLVY
ncbi:MAG: type II toxin-antitoxin system RelE/ParE family toxin [Gammaproteobacteria bacterium]|nr:type II toxin-antitoxin system RelE/ParE family toxin [Gammaproteobacteria bacterium]